MSSSRRTFNILHSHKSLYLPEDFKGWLKLESKQNKECRIDVHQSYDKTKKATKEDPISASFNLVVKPGFTNKLLPQLNAAFKKPEAINHEFFTLQVLELEDKYQSESLGKSANPKLLIKLHHLDNSAQPKPSIEPKSPQSTYQSAFSNEEQVEILNLTNSNSFDLDLENSFASKRTVQIRSPLPNKKQVEEKIEIIQSIQERVKKRAKRLRETNAPHPESWPVESKVDYLYFTESEKVREHARNFLNGFFSDQNINKLDSVLTAETTGKQKTRTPACISFLSGTMEYTDLNDKTYQKEVCFVSLSGRELNVDQPDIGLTNEVKAFVESLQEISDKVSYVFIEKYNQDKYGDVLNALSASLIEKENIRKQHISKPCAEKKMFAAMGKVMSKNQVTFNMEHGDIHLWLYPLTRDQLAVESDNRFSKALWKYQTSQFELDGDRFAMVIKCCNSCAVLKKSVLDYLHAATQTKETLSAQASPLAPYCDNHPLMQELDRVSASFALANAESPPQTPTVASIETESLGIRPRTLSAFSSPIANSPHVLFTRKHNEEQKACTPTNEISLQFNC